MTPFAAAVTHLWFAPVLQLLPDLLQQPALPARWHGLLCCLLQFQRQDVWAEGGRQRAEDVGV